ncbi:MAG TPA: class I SAM-dependent methyltransferase [Solirubrobacteraceae bacterium]|nr:class I SAM-dependent methyltransferase [Solirubrobacteraceae bacterium]
MSALHTRPRIRRLIERAAQRALAAVAEPTRAVDPPAHESAPGPPLHQSAPATATPTPASAPVSCPPPGPPLRFERELAPALLAVERASASARLYERLSEQDVADVTRRIMESELHSLYEDALARHPGLVPTHMILAFGMWLQAPAVLERTGLPRVLPPEDVHAMVRGPYASAGGLYEADLVIDALLAAGQDPERVRDALDFGCSSGRVVRTLAAAYPQTAWRGCDPNAEAIAWAGANLPGIEFFVNGDAPPLALADASLDLVYAISIWSHFAPELGLAWFEEMRRIIRPGGQLVCTTHGPTSVSHYVLEQHRTTDQAREILDALQDRGCWYAPEFGEEGDWGVVNPSWGTAFLSPEWMLTKLCPRWRVLEFAPGRNQDNQDVYVLERV